MKEIGIQLAIPYAALPWSVSELMPLLQIVRNPAVISCLFNYLVC